MKYQILFSGKNKKKKIINLESTELAKGVVTVNCISARLIRGSIHIIFFSFLHKNICCGYSLEAPQ